MSWQGANIARRRRSQDRHGRASETVEAILNRLSKSYQAAMDCVGACHRAANSADDSSGNKHATIAQVARTARKTLERGVLIDPLVQSHAPALAQAWEERSKQDNGTATNLWAWVSTVRRYPPPSLTSAAHRLTVRKLSYLSLTNYADLLLSGCARQPEPTNNTNTILDRGVVNPLLKADEEAFWIWNDSQLPEGSVPLAEDESETILLALIAYMDALNLDGSDPTVWFKMASTARRLDNLNQGARRYRRLEQHALECAQACWLTQHRPPNRTIALAWEEWQQDPDLLGSPDFLVTPPQNTRDMLQLSLPRYSWAVVGRNLSRACREGTSFRLHPHDQPSAQDKLGVNPVVLLHIAPFLTLPSAVLGQVISFLDIASVARLECTCKALSVAVLAARARADHAVALQKQKEDEEMVQPSADPSSTTDSGKKPADKSSEGLSKEEKAVQGSRVSKRLQSRVENSDKKAARARKKASLEYCFLGAVLGAPPSQVANTPVGLPQPKQTNRKALRSNPTGEEEGGRDEAQERTGSGSLAAFVASVTEKSPTPLYALFHFLSHVSIHVSDCYSCESHGSLVLSTCVMDALALLVRRVGFRGFVPCWCMEESLSSLSPVELFAVDLLHAELRLKRCERDENIDTSFEGDINFVGQAVPTLTSFAEEFEITNDPSGVKKEEWIRMKVRCHWLASTFLLWHARMVHSAAEVRNIENECLENADKILETMEESGIQEVRIPHLEEGRSGPYWKKLSKSTLIAFHSEIQASSIVLVAQDQFVEACSKIASLDENESISECQQVFTSIADALLKRYEIPAGSSGANHVELIDDFLTVHGQDLWKTREEINSWFSNIVPLSPLDKEQLGRLHSPCILTIFAACLSFQPEKLGRSKLVKVFFNLVSTLRVLRDEVVIESSPSPNTDENEDDSSMDSEADFEDTGPDKKASLLKMYSRLLVLLLGSLNNLMDQDWFAANPDSLNKETCAPLIENAFVFITDAAHSKGHHSGVDETTEDVLILVEVSSLLESWYHNVSKEEHPWLLCLHLKHMMAATVSHQQCLEEVSKNMGQANKRQDWLTVGSIHFLCKACNDVSKVLSQTSVCTASNKKISRSAVYESLGDLVAPFCKSLVWLWEMCRLSGGQSKGPPLRVMGKLMKVPVAVAIISVCGSASFTRDEVPSEPQDISLMDVVDSDASATRCLSEEDAAHKEILRVTFLAVQCFHLISDSIRDNELTEGFQSECVGSATTMLPILERVLNFFADVLLLNPSQSTDDEEQTLWADYSFGARSVGSQIDKLLHRVYKAMYGFNLAHVAGEGKDASGANYDDSRPIQKPKDVKAAAQLYRCVMRVCSHGRKAAPKAALVTITGALPPVQETAKSTTVKNFLFSDDTLTRDSVVALVNCTGDWETSFARLGGLWETPLQPRHASAENEAEVVRKGLADLFSQGSMPSLENSVVEKDARAQHHAESELGNKFEAVLYKLTHDKTSDCEAWYRFSQLCLFKADMIADRLGLSKGFSRSRDFVCEAGKMVRRKGVPLARLRSDQEKEVIATRNTWIPSLGRDLRVYLDYCWSSFESLKLLQQKLGDACRSSAASNAIDLKVWNEIAGLYTEGKLGLWSDAWGGIFVSSLRIIAARCMCVSLFILYKKIGISDDAKRNALIAEICEALGTALYDDMIGSQLYGYPMKVMPKQDKRETALAALACFERALQNDDAAERQPEDKKDARMTWDLHFMVGKCHEKIGGTFLSEDFSSNSRTYEQCMMSAMKSYSTSLAQAQELEKEGALIVEQQGGSSHGAVEILYRLQASRLKCLLSAMKHCEDERANAELEALRLCEPFPFAERGEEKAVNETVRDRVWNVAVDVALMWAPMLADPEEAKSEGSFGVVPAIKALNMRGLNSDSAIESAATVMRSLFDKKRAQLCAVWVTSTSVEADTAFQRINLEVRKYDALRAKYVSAFITALRLCNKRDDLENFLRWTTSCHRDLPSFFHASALSGGKAPETATHTYDNLILRPRSLASMYFLTAVKREANAALAAVLLHEVDAPKASREARHLENQLKLAYSCFLRLNCDPSALTKRSVRNSAGVKPVVDALIAVHSKMSTAQLKGQSLNDWSIDGQFNSLVEAALQKSSALFPSLSGSFLTSKKNPKKKKPKEEGPNQLVGSKRKEPDGTYTVLQQFNVQVPEGLSSGESFLTEIQTGETIKRIRLTVPDGSASNLRFNLRVPAPESSQEAADPPS